MTKRLSEMSDNEINIAIAEKLGINFDTAPHGEWIFDTDKGYYPLDYCKPSAESMQLMIDNKIDLNTGCELVNDEWEDNELWDASTAGVIANHENPCRAIAMCFLMTKGWEL